MKFSSEVRINVASDRDEFPLIVDIFGADGKMLTFEYIKRSELPPSVFKQIRDYLAAGAARDIPSTATMGAMGGAD